MAIGVLALMFALTGELPTRETVYGPLAELTARVQGSAPATVGAKVTETVHWVLLGSEFPHVLVSV